LKIDAVHSYKFPSIMIRFNRITSVYNTTIRGLGSNEKFCFLIPKTSLLSMNVNVNYSCC